MYNRGNLLVTDLTDKLLKHCESISRSGGNFQNTAKTPAAQGEDFEISQNHQSDCRKFLKFIEIVNNFAGRF